MIRQWFVPSARVYDRYYWKMSSSGTSAALGQRATWFSQIYIRAGWRPIGTTAIVGIDQRHETASSAS